MVAVDPNLPHRGVEDPERHALALLDHLGLDGNALAVPALSLERNLGDDVASARQPAGTGALASLERLGVSVGVAVIDGDHDAAHLERVLEALAALLAPRRAGRPRRRRRRRVPGGRRAGRAGGRTYEPAGRDGRAGVLRHVAPAPA